MKLAKKRKFNFFWNEGAFRIARTGRLCSLDLSRAEDYLLKHGLFTRPRPEDHYELVRATGRLKHSEFLVRRASNRYEIKIGSELFLVAKEKFEISTGFRMKPGEVRRYYFRRVQHE